MPKYNVTIPCTMGVCVTVEADDEDAAKAAAMEVPWRVELVTDDDAGRDASPEVLMMETHDRIVQGNVFRGCINEVDVEEA